jgi:alkanesulfonate monooxygenase SsuD/methylene tetrahydromethanopterin reductase-like flavin-dependent oxidoreductase (luciferase family)
VTLRHVAAFADGWNTFLMPLDEFDHKLTVLDGHCADVGRPRAEIRIQLVLQAVLGADDLRSQISCALAQTDSVLRSTSCASGCWR